MFRSGKNTSAQFGIRALDEARRIGTIGHSNATFEHAYLYQLFVRRGEAFGKLGYIFPNKRYTSIGLLGNYIVYDQKTTLGERWYDARQFSGYASIIYQSIISNTNHKFRTGFNLQQDQINENFASNLYSRNEVVTGAFFEYTGEFGRSSLVAGLRGDYNNLFGWFATPRIHYKFQWSEKLAIRVSGGRGQRTANVLGENISYLVSSRLVGLPANQTKNSPYGLLPEIGWNAGGAINSEYELSGRTGFISADIYYTWFQRQTVVDLDASPQHLFFYNQNRNSSAASAQLDLSQEISNRFDVKLSYKYTGAFTTYQTSGRLQRPFLAPHRGLANIGYHSRKNSWLVDLTLNYIGKMRLPDSQTNPVGFRMLSDSPAYTLLNIQITRNYKRWAVYVGMENIGNEIQERRIVSPEDPHSTYFDASYSWGPAFGRMLYGGLRYVISKK
jgi:outer membrane receptor for ferrienterochelin and colicin